MQSLTIPGLYAFTVCDSVSAFNGRGKVGALKLVMKGDRQQKDMEGLGETWILSKELLILLEEFVCNMYAPQTCLTNVSVLIYQHQKRGCRLKSASTLGRYPFASCSACELPSLHMAQMFGAAN